MLTKYINHYMNFYKNKDFTMKNMVIKIILEILITIAVLIVITTIAFFAVSTGKIEPFSDKNGKILEGSISEKIKISVNGADNGLIIRGKNIENPVLLFVSSGPGTSDYFYNEAYPDMNLEDYYTVCYWDYRGMCLVYDKNIDPETITTKQILDDTKAVTDYLCERFNKEKIYIMGFSGGTHIALEAVEKWPEKYEAYFAMAQTVSSDEDNDTYMYDFMKKVFSERGDKKNLKKLEDSVNHIENSDKVVCKDWPSYVYLLHNAGGGTIKDKTEFSGIIIPIMKSHCYTVKEKFDYIKGMKMYRTTPFYKDVKTRDYRKMITKVDVPVYFISGDTDYNCPWPLVKEYCKMLEAPKKDFVLIPNSAHSPLWENPKDTINYLTGLL